VTEVVTLLNGAHYAKVADLRTWSDNPRTISKDDFERLRQQAKLGEHSTLLITPDGLVLGGNTRLEFYHESGKEYTRVIVVDIRQEGDIWVAYVDGQKADKVFDTEQQAKLEYALSHNDQIGRYDDQKLAELLHVSPIPMQTFKVASFARPLEDVSFQAGPAPAPGDRQADQDTTETEKLDAYLNGDIKQIVLYFDAVQYQEVQPRLQRLKEEHKVLDNASLFMMMLDEYEKAA
jgi:hypothetical protein